MIRETTKNDFTDICRIAVEDLGVDLIRLNSGSARKEAHSFYRKIGYNSEKEQIRFMKTFYLTQFVQNLLIIQLQKQQAMFIKKVRKV